MGEFYFDPNVFTIPANTDFTVTLVNKGLVGHDFNIADPAVSSPLIAPGDTATITLNLPAGSYEFTCSVEGHADAGMYGKVTAL
jgi:plastocyanin